MHRCSTQDEWKEELVCITMVAVVWLLQQRNTSCQYLAERLITAEAETLLKNHCICLCDDDNDIEMALACHHAFLPSIASDSMRQTVIANPTQFTPANGAYHALQLALELISSPSTNQLQAESSHADEE